MQSIDSKTIKLRLVEEDDAEFILSLRLDDRYNSFLSKVGPNLKSQKEWIKKYKQDETEGKQFYFIIERLDGEKCGTVRLYDFRNDSFSWGSWILNENKTRYAAIESALLVYRYGFDVLGFERSHFEVMNDNKNVISFHEKMGAARVDNDEINIYFEIKKSTVNALEKKFRGKFI